MERTEQSADIIKANCYKNIIMWKYKDTDSLYIMQMGIWQVSHTGAIKLMI